MVFQKKTHEEYIADLKAKRPNIICLGVYVDSQTKLEHQCLICSHVWQTFPPNMVRNRNSDKVGCPKCRRSATIKSRIQTREEYNLKLEIAGISMRCVDKYINCRTPVKHQCINCGYTAIQEPDSLLHANKNDGSKCFACSYNGHYRNGFTRRECKIGGRKFTVQGFEPLALKYMHEHLKMPVSKIAVGSKVPRIYYRENDKQRLYIPDFYIPHRNRIVEVKSVWTFSSNKTKFTNIKRKRRAVIAAGYRFKVYVYDDRKQLVTLPKGWYNMKYTEFKTWSASNEQFRGVCKTRIIKTAVLERRGD